MFRFGFRPEPRWTDQRRTDMPTALILLTLRFHDPHGLHYIEKYSLPQAFVQRPIFDHGSGDRKSTRLNSSHGYISYAVFCLKKKKTQATTSSTHRVDCRQASRALLQRR